MQEPLTLQDRLEILRAADRQRKWTSLDDRRICTRCNKLIIGRQIEIQRDSVAGSFSIVPLRIAPRPRRIGFIREAQ